jgi:hypothetical protein
MYRQSAANAMGYMPRLIVGSLPSVNGKFQDTVVSRLQYYTLNYMCMYLLTRANRIRNDNLKLIVGLPNQEICHLSRSPKLHYLPHDTPQDVLLCDR